MVVGLLNQPADTLNYMLAGYGVIFGLMGMYIVSLINRYRKLRRDEKALKDLKKK